MNKTLISISLVLVLAFTTFGQLKFESNEYPLVCNGRPSLSKNTKPITRKQSEELLKKIKATPIQFNYLQGNCHNRAHIISLIISSLGYHPVKVWAFAPGKYSLIDTSLIKIDDKNGISPSNSISWGYHVASAVFVKNGNSTELLVIDPSSSPDKPVNESIWLKSLKKENVMYTVIDSDWYLFNTLNGLKVWNNKNNDPSICDGEKNLVIPDWFPGIITGDFYKYEGSSKDQNWMEKGLAVDDTAYQFYTNEIKPIQNDNSKKQLVDDYKLVVGKINNFETVFRDGGTTDDIKDTFLVKHKVVIDKYKSVYDKQLTKWIEYVSKIK